MEQFSAQKFEKLIADAKASGGAERANYQIFVNELCDALGITKPTFSKDDDVENNYVFERKIKFNLPDGTSTPGWIDCYKRSSFILEAKQSKKRVQKAAAKNSEQISLLGDVKANDKPTHAKRGWDQIMLSARKQAEDYAKALPVDHGYPPFLLIVDVGNVIEVYADFSGQGKNYAHFPDRQSFRLSMDDLLDSKVQERLTSIWDDPFSLDPTRISAEVTKDVAERLAKIATVLEKKHDAKDVAEFLMRCLFTMFAEDAGLIPDKAFENLLKDLKDAPDNFVPAMESLWSAMNAGNFSPYLNKKLKKFNGGLFKHSRALPLGKDQIEELYIAAKREWKDVEPAIFGTLLERALNPRERSKLGAHYTPRTYVERLVIPAIIEPLRADWQDVLDNAADLHLNGDRKAALAEVKKFHHKLCTTRVLDPACGTGNFLYVSLELMKRLEGDVLEALSAFGETEPRLALNTETVSPHQFYGLELNPRAVPIADLVLWLGYLKWQLKTAGLQLITEPVLHAYGTIKEQDAILQYDRQEVIKDAKGLPLSRWDGVTKKLHPVTGEEIPDLDAKIPLYKYVNPRPVIWPDAEFIVGNPPFIGNKRMIQRLGEEYVVTLRECYRDVPDSVDFVMYWWWKASQAVEKKTARTFGLVTTSKISQAFNRKIVERFLHSQIDCSLGFAIPDHPWTDESTSAAVRVAMTVGVLGNTFGKVLKLIGDGDQEPLSFAESYGIITQRLTKSDIPLKATRLAANQEIAHQGVIPLGEGFRILANEFTSIVQDQKSAVAVIKPYKIGRDLLQRDQGLYIIDLFGLDWGTVTSRFPRIAQIVLDRIKPQRDSNRRPKRKEKFWLYADSCEDMRNGLMSLPRYIVTCRTAKHRIFNFLSGDVLPDAKIVAITSEAPSIFVVLSSRLHIAFSILQGGWQGVGNDPVYQHSDTFNPFPFPDLTSRQALQDRLRELGERLDSFRKERLAAHNFLTMTGLYNALERYRERGVGIGKPLTAFERDAHEAGLISVLAEIHDDIDRSTFSAYGWEDLAPALVGKVGGTVPSEHKSEAQLEAEEELLRRLVALNHARAAEEKRGIIRWLRPEYQIPKLGSKAPKAKTEELGLEVVETIFKPKWPTDGLAQIRVVRDILNKSQGLITADAISLGFDGRNSAARKARVFKVLETMVGMGTARASDDGAKFFIPR